MSKNNDNHPSYGSSEKEIMEWLTQNYNDYILKFPEIHNTTTYGSTIHEQPTYDLETTKQPTRDLETINQTNKPSNHQIPCEVLVDTILTIRTLPLNPRILPSLIYNVLEQYKNATEIQQIRIRNEIGREINYETFNMLCVISNNVEMLQSESRSNEYQYHGALGWTISEIVFLYQRKDMVKPLINAGYIFCIASCFYVFDSPHTFFEKLSIIKTFYFDALSTTSRKTLTTLISGIFSDDNDSDREPSPLNKSIIPVNVAKIIYGYVIGDFDEIKRNWVNCLNVFWDIVGNYDFYHNACPQTTQNEIWLITRWIDQHNLPKPMKKLSEIYRMYK